MSTANKKMQKIRSKDTKVSDIEKEYNVDMGVSSDMKLSAFLEKEGYPSIAALLEENE